MKPRLLYLSLLSLLLLGALIGLQSPGHASAAGKTFIGCATASCNWSNPAAWSPVGVPGSGDDVILNATSVKSLIIDIPATANSLLIDTGYTGVITQKDDTTSLSVALDLTQRAGRFNNNSLPAVEGVITKAAINVGRDFTLQAGTFNSTSGTFTLGGNLTYNGGSFRDHSGTLEFTGASTITVTGPSALILYKMIIDPLHTVNAFASFSLEQDFINDGTFFAEPGVNFIIGTATFPATSHLSGGGAFDFVNLIVRGGSSMNVANMSIAGNLTVDGTLNSTGTTTFAGATTISGINASGLHLVNVVLNGTRLTANPGTLYIDGDWTHNSGTFVPNGGTIIFDNPTFQTLSYAGGVKTETFFNLQIAASSLLDTTDDFVAATGTLTQSGGLRREAPGQTLSSVSTASFNDSLNKVTTVITETVGSMGNTAVTVTANEPAAGLPCSDTQLGGAPILRYWNIAPTTDTGILADLTLYFRVTELNGNDPAHLQFYHCEVDRWRGYLPTSYTTGPVFDSVTLKNVPSFSLWALSGAPGQPTAVTLNSFSAESETTPMPWSFGFGAMGLLLLGSVLLVRRH